jgi:hypothetical protein
VKLKGFGPGSYLPDKLQAFLTVEIANIQPIQLAQHADRSSLGCSKSLGSGREIGFQTTEIAHEF